MKKHQEIIRNSGSNRNCTSSHSIAPPGSYWPVPQRDGHAEGVSGLIALKKIESRGAGGARSPYRPLPKVKCAHLLRGLNTKYHDKGETNMDWTGLHTLMFELNIAINWVCRKIVYPKRIMMTHHYSPLIYIYIYIYIYGICEGIPIFRQTDLMNCSCYITLSKKCPRDVTGPGKKSLWQRSSAAIGGHSWQVCGDETPIPRFGDGRGPCELNIDGLTSVE